MSSLRNKTINGVIWNAVQTIGTKIIQLIITIIIARVLLPGDYGLVGMLFIFIALGNVFLDSGFSQALIRRKEVNNSLYSSVFYLNILIGVILYFILFFSSPYIANFYNEPELEEISKVIFLIFPISAFGIIHNAMMNRAINFRLLAKISLTSTLISGIIGIWMAYNGYGVWALVFQSILFSVFQVLMFWLLNRWKPILNFEISSIKEIFSFSMNLLSTNILIVVFNNIYTLIIGKFYSADKVGYYNQAKRFEEIPTSSLTSIIQKVTYPVLSQLQDDIERLKQGYRKVINLAVYLNFPLMIGLIVIAHDLFLVLLTEKWLPSVPYFQLLCIHGVFFPLHSINVNILKVQNKGKMLLKLELIRRFIIVIAILATINYGIFALLIGHVVASLISIGINMYYCGKEINLGLKEQLFDILPMLFIASFAGFSAYFCLQFFIEINIYASLALQIFVLCLVYFSLSRIFKIKSYTELFKIIKQKLK